MYYKKYMPGLDIIRAAALLSVLLFHLFPRAFPGGFLGVETFFVLTGFLLAINDGPERRENILHFYGRKLRRLYPPLLLVLLLTCGLMALFLPAALYGLRGETLSALLGFSAVSLALLMPAAYLLTGSVSFVYYSTPTGAFSLFLGVLAGLSYRGGNPIGKFFMRIMKNSMTPTSLSSTASTGITCRRRTSPPSRTSNSEKYIPRPLWTGFPRRRQRTFPSSKIPLRK